MSAISALPHAAASVQMLAPSERGQVAARSKHGGHDRRSRSSKKSPCWWLKVGRPAPAPGLVPRLVARSHGVQVPQCLSLESDEGGFRLPDMRRVPLQMWLKQSHLEGSGRLPEISSPRVACTQPLQRAWPAAVGSVLAAEPDRPVEAFWSARQCPRRPTSVGALPGRARFKANHARRNLVSATPRLRWW